MNNQPPLDPTSSIFPSNVIDMKHLDKISGHKLSKIDLHIARYVNELANTVSKAINI